MKRIFYILIMLFSFLNMDKPAYAIDTYVHGDFATHTSSCAYCHTTHAAGSAALLENPNDRTRMCLACHGFDSASSQYDVYSGKTTGTDGVARPSPAGGFTISADPYSNWTNYGTAVKPENTSSHHIDSNDTINLELGQIDGDIPGGSTSFTGVFTCCSCHDPHAGGRYPAISGPYKNPRLLKKRPVDSTTDKLVYMKIDYDYDPGTAWSETGPNTDGNHTSQVIEYGRGFNEWCGSCHNLFNTEGTGAENPTRTGSYGIDNGEGVSKMRHKVGVSLTSTTHTGFSTSIKDGTPLPTNTNGNRDAATTSTNMVSCMTCHRAHGSSVEVSIGFNRFKGYETYFTDGEGAVISKDTIDAGDLGGNSALLRLPERDACFKCHGAALYNKYSGTDKYGTGY